MEKSELISIEEKIIPVLTNLGFELVETKFEKEFGTDTLTVFIYKKGGVQLDDCEKVSDALNPILDEMDFGSSGYNFNVSSPGLDRPIVSMDDYRRNIGEDVEIVFLKPIGKKKSEHGILLSYTEDSFVVRLSNGKEVSFDKKSASVVRPYIHF